MGKTATNACAHRGALLVGDGLDQPGGKLRSTMAGVISSSSPFAPAWSVARSSINCRAASMRRGIRQAAHLLTEASSDAAISAPSRSRAWSPHAPTRRTSCARAAGVSSTVSFLSASAVAPSTRAGRSLGQPRATPAQDRLVHRRLAAGQGRQKRADRLGRAAPGPVLGHAVGDQQHGPRRPAFFLARRGPSRTTRHFWRPPPWRRRPATGRSSPARREAPRPRPRRPRPTAVDRPGSRAPPAAPGRRDRASKPAASTAPADRRIARQDLGRIAANSGRRMLERGRGGTGRRRFEVGQGAQALERPERMDRPGFRPIASTEPSRTSSISAGTTSVLPRSTSSRWACSRQN